MSCLISFVWTSLKCEEWEASEKFKMKIYVSNERPLAFQPGALDHSVTLAVCRMCFKLLHYLGFQSISSTSVKEMKIFSDSQFKYTSNHNQF